MNEYIIESPLIKSPFELNSFAHRFRPVKSSLSFFLSRCLVFKWPPNTLHTSDDFNINGSCVTYRKSVPFANDLILHTFYIYEI
jgi:hypothetical protein